MYPGNCVLPLRAELDHYPAPALDTLDELYALVARIYDAALDESLWTEVIGKIVNFVGGSAGALFYKDVLNNTGNAYYQSGADPDWLDVYFERYIGVDPSTAIQFFAEIGQMLSAADIMRYQDFVRTQFYKEWMAPQRLADCLNTILDKTSTTVAIFSVFRNDRQGAVDDKMRTRMNMLVPHIRRAALISRLFEHAESRVGIFSDLLDELDVGIFLVESSGHIVYANQTGRDLLLCGALLRDTGGRITATDAQADNQLRQNFTISADRETSGIPVAAIPLTSRRGEQYIGQVLPLASSKRIKASTRNKAAAALFVRKTALGDPLPPEMIRQAFGLTPTELRVLMAIVDVGGVPDVASSLGVAVTTVRTHLKRLYEKTGVNRQADLVKLMAGFTTPLRTRS